ncbi:DUF3718 domain-containing protein [Psychrosphaera ytuae]|uniref:DUF3718 domain-containing protein n=1 Tax=Psychrosphaera ytuae TaxID=2820710 RepID=A0A975DDG8_9GAMM|nr:DUF3718 domain-containing protein [Psychrosphaera ytuae]QTH65137.1 DUF3718 domain-containing protein [Psychrosphaera ytuae]
MKLLVSLLSTVLVVSALSTSAPAQADVASFLAGVCDNVATDNKSRFRKKLKNAGVKLRNIYDGVTCGGDNLIRYAMQKNAESVGVFMVKRLPSSHFDGSGDLEWAKANGFGDSKIAEAIASR